MQITNKNTAISQKYQRIYIDLDLFHASLVIFSVSCRKVSLLGDVRAIESNTVGDKLKIRSVITQSFQRCVPTYYLLPTYFIICYSFVSQNASRMKSNEFILVQEVIYSDLCYSTSTPHLTRSSVENIECSLGILVPVVELKC